MKHKISAFRITSVTILHWRSVTVGDATHLVNMLMMTHETGIKIFPVIVPDYIDIKWPENVDSKIGKAIENVLTAEADEMEKGEKVHCSKTHGSEKNDMPMALSFVTINTVKWRIVYWIEFNNNMMMDNLIRNIKDIQKELIRF